MLLPVPKTKTKNTIVTLGAVMGGRGGGGKRWSKGGGDNRGGGSAPNQQWQPSNARDKREEIKNFLGFYKRKDSVCIDLYQPEFYWKKPTWEEMALFVSDC